MTGVAFWSNNGNTLVVPANTGTNPHNSDDDVYPLIYIRQATYTAPIGYKGVSAFCTMLGTSRSTGDTLTISGSSDHIVLGQFVFNWNGSTPLV